MNQTKYPSSLANYADPFGIYPWSVCPAQSTTSGGTTQQLRATGFGFSIPDGKTVKGVSAKVRRSASEYSTDFQAKDDYYGTRLLKGGVVGPNQPKYDPWEVSPTDVVLGGSMHLWGTTLTPADVNSPDFGISIMALTDAPEGKRGSVSIHSIELTVYFE